MGDSYRAVQVPRPLFVTCGSCPSLLGKSSVSQVFVLCALRVLGQYLVYAHRCLSRSLPLAHLVKVIRCSATFTLRPVTLLCNAPSTGKSQVLLCAATFKFRGHLSIAFSWSLAFSRPKNGPDRITGSHSAAKRRFQRSARHATSEGGHEQASDTVSASLARLEHTLAVHNPPPLAFHRSYYDSSPRL